MSDSIFKLDDMERSGTFWDIKPEPKTAWGLWERWMNHTVSVFRTQPFQKRTKIKVRFED